MMFIHDVYPLSMFIHDDFAERNSPPVKDAIYSNKKHLRPRDISISASLILVSSFFTDLSFHPIS